MLPSGTPMALPWSVLPRSIGPPRSMLPRSISIAPDSPEVARPRRRQLQLTEETTQPIRLHLDFDSLYEETAPPYSACFEVGAWFARGVPGPEPPEDGVATCEFRGTAAEYEQVDCWGRCTADDLVTSDGRAMIEGVVRALVTELSNLFAVVPEEEALTFTVSKGRYQHALELIGYELEGTCASDCTTANQVAVAPSYCNEGVAADAVLSVTKPPTVWGVGGTGTHCQASAQGRPTWLVFSWLHSVAAEGATDGTLEAQIERHRGLVMHELIHALGFTNGMFVGARNANGERKELLELRAVSDADGETDEVWTFTHGRAWESAMRYFGCDDGGGGDVPEEVVGLPLMGRPELGRASHWETRILRDDVMSYGGRSAVSSITLAAMEDLGHYRANYSAADCISWGRSAGCGFVTSRCGEEVADQSEVPESAEQCGGDPGWAYEHDAYLDAKCSGGVAPCATLAFAGYSNVGGVRTCNAQCYTGPRADCREQLAPSGDVEEAADSVLLGRKVSASWMQWALLGIYAAIAATSIVFVRSWCCPPEGSAALMYAASSLLVVAGAAGVLLSAVALHDLEWHDHLSLAAEQLKLVGGKSAQLGVGIACGVLLANGVATTLGIAVRRHECARVLLLGSFAFWLLLLLVLLGLCGLIVWWIVAMESIAQDSLAQLQTTVSEDGGGRHAHRLGGRFLAEVEGLVCHAYQKCCRDPALDLPLDGGGDVIDLGSGGPLSNSSGGGTVFASAAALGASNRTCVYGHEGVGTALQLALDDPSQPGFCEYVCGSSLSLELPDGVCDLLDLADELRHCDAGFCTLGVEGYFEFVEAFVRVVIANAQYASGCAMLLVLANLVLVFNLWHLHRTQAEHRRDLLRRANAANAPRGRSSLAQQQPAGGWLWGRRASTVPAAPLPAPGGCYDRELSVRARHDLAPAHRGFDRISRGTLDHIGPNLAGLGAAAAHSASYHFNSPGKRERNTAPCRV